MLKDLLQKRKYRKELLAEADCLRNLVLQSLDNLSECGEYIVQFEDCVRAYNELFADKFDRDFHKYRRKRARYFDKLCKRYDNIDDICDRYQN